jgi:putative nucleotidyltransferase with HDIG domain
MLTTITESVDNELIPVSLSTLIAGSAVGVDLFMCESLEARPVLFCTQDSAITPARLQQLSGEGVSKLYIHRDSYESYQGYLRENLALLLENESISPIDRVAIMGDVVRAVLKEQMPSKDTAQLVETCVDLGNSITRILGDQPVLVSDLCDVLHHDYATFTHSTNVASYAVVLASELGFSEADLKEIAVGALLHDLGKLEIPDRILTKPGRLDDFEFREIKKHPTIGFQRLVEEQQRLSYPQLMMVYQHHEKLNGEGYPVGISSDEIHPWAKLCAVVDIFEALTSQRPYRKPMTLPTAIAVLEKAAGTEIDEEMVRCWKSIVQRQG